MKSVNELEKAGKQSAHGNADAGSLMQICSLLFVLYMG